MLSEQRWLTLLTDGQDACKVLLGDIIVPEGLEILQYNRMPSYSRFELKFPGVNVAICHPLLREEWILHKIEVGSEGTKKRPSMVEEF